MFKSTTELCDVVSHVVFCVNDGSILLTLDSTTNEYWIPSSKITDDCSWHKQSVKDVDELFGMSIHTRKLLRLYKVWTPKNSNSYIYHSIYQLDVTADQKKKLKTNTGKFRGKVRWVTEQEVVKIMLQEMLRSPEILEFYKIVKGNECPMQIEGSNVAEPIEFVYTGKLVEIADRIMISVVYDNAYQQMIESASFNEDFQIALFQEFIFLCFPAMYMSHQSFIPIITSLGWSKEEATYVFRAADVKGRSALSYRDFLYVLAAMEPTTSHAGSSAELRCRYIFRFFDRDRDSALNCNEFKNLIIAIRKVKKQPIDANNVNKDAEACYKTMGITESSAISIDVFLHAVGDLKLRGTSHVFRSPISMMQHLKDLRDRESKLPKNAKMAKNDFKLKSAGNNESSGCGSSKGDYEIAKHTIRLQKSGTLISIDELENLGGGAISLSTTQHITMSGANRRLSQDQFNQTSITNEILKCTRYLMQMNKNKTTAKGLKGKEPHNWGQLDPAVYAKNLITICNQVKEQFKNESRLLELESPAYIMGDLHGNLVSLLYLEKVLWHLGPGLCPCNLIFLGDFVDRGPFGIEVISYLLCYKLQAPRKIWLVRGNHEIREVQKLFTFYSECLTKFGDKLGSVVWNTLNDVFDVLPIAAVVDRKLFCCHGGIPPPWLCPAISAIKSIPTPLPNPDDQSALAWDILWNDPVNKQKPIPEEVALELLANDGFAINRRRGTAHMFSADALERFLNSNGFSHIIRAHEVVQTGFNVLQNGKLLTVFSTSKYCGGTNEAACILVDQGKLRILRLEPT